MVLKLSRTSTSHTKIQPQLRPQQTSLTRNKQWKISTIYPSNEEIWRTSTNRIESLKSPSSKKNKQKTCNFTKKKSTNDDLKEQFFLKSKRKKITKTIKEEWINGWNRRKKNHIDLSTISLLQNSSHLTNLAVLEKWKLSEKKVKNTRKIKQNTFRRFIKTGEVLKNSRKMKKEEENSIIFVSR